jgi:hypothetical protein
MINVDISHLKRGNLKKKRTSPTPSLVKTGKTEKVISNKVLPKENIVSNENELLPSQIEVDFELSDSKELNSYLITKSQELLGVQINARLHLGRIFQDVFHKLSGSPHNGVYVKWLEINGFNKMTALRHKNRYKLYKIMPTDHLKFLIATTSQKIVEVFLSDQEKLDLLISMDMKLSKNELSIIALSSNDHNLILEKELQFDIVEEYDVFKERISELDISRLDQKQKIKFSKLVEGFNRLLKEIK